jgi:hypothetical protein
MRIFWGFTVTRKPGLWNAARIHLYEEIGVQMLND